MTQPSLHQAFDTSLIDLSPEKAQTSFSTTESASSEEYRQASASISVPAPLNTSTPKFEEASTTSSKMPTRYVPTVDAYDAWADVYDSDGNVLQALDDYELGAQGMLAEFWHHVSESQRPSSPHENGNLLTLVDLGCGTGRNTIALCKHAISTRAEVQITGIDASAGMLAKARDKLQVEVASMPVQLLQHDFLDPRDARNAPVPLLLPLPGNQQFHGLISTLVLEHFPLRAFFLVLSSLLKPGGVALVTNMHAEMGEKSQAGFVSQDEKTGEAIKVRGTSFVFTVEDTVDEARRMGFEILGDVRETGVTREMIEDGVVGARAEKWVGVKMWYGMILRKIS